MSNQIKLTMAIKHLLFLSLLVSSSINWAICKKDYADYQLVHVVPENDDQVNSLKTLANNEDFDQGLDFWLRPSESGQDLSVLTKQGPELTKQLIEDGMKPRTLIEDVASEIKKSKYLRTSSSNSDFFAKFNSYQAIIKKIESYERNNGRKLSLVNLGPSGLGSREVLLAKVTSSNSRTRPIILIEAGQHAREWISVSTAMYLLDTVLKKGTSLNKKLAQYDFWFIPMVNPDGYEHSRTQDRFWLKTRSEGNSPDGGSECLGADLSRNFKVNWGEGDSTGNSSCSNSYPGHQAASEIEGRYLANVIRNNKARIKMYLSLRSFGELILWPYSYSDKSANNEDRLRLVAEAGRAAIESKRGKQYTIGNAHSLRSASSGTSTDFAKEKNQIEYVYTLELSPGPASTGYLVPASQIKPVGQEIVAAVGAMLDKVTQLSKDSE